MMAFAKVVVVDPQPFFCVALAAGLGAQPGVVVVGTTTDERAALGLAETLSPDVVVTEVALDRGSGLSLATQLRRTTAVVVLTRRHEGDILLDAVAAGAAGCVSHQIDLAALAGLLTRVGSDRFVIDDARLYPALRRAAENRAGGEGSSAAAVRLARLTLRQREILDLVGQGLRNEEIAARLYLSPETVRTHIGHIWRKLGVHSRSEAVRLVTRARRTAPEGTVLRIRGPELGAS